jgi:hypothetical protein
MILTQDYRRIQAHWGTDGDFITPEGKVIHVGENHTIFMMDHPEMFGGSDDPDDMVGQGWIRTREALGTFLIDAGGGMNEAQLHVVQKMVLERCRYSNPRLAVVLPGGGDAYQPDCDDFIEIRYPNQIKRSPRVSSLDTKTKFSRPLAKEEDWDSGEYNTSFWVGNFEYMVIFEPHRGSESGHNFEVFFRVNNHHFSSDEEMIQVTSKMAKKPLDLVGAKMFLENLRRYGLTGLGDSRPVLSGVINAITKFIKLEDPDCLIFDAYELKRREFYEFLLGRLKSKLNFRYDSRLESNAMVFTLCLNE